MGDGLDLTRSPQCRTRVFVVANEEGEKETESETPRGISAERARKSRVRSRMRESLD